MSTIVPSSMYQTGNMQKMDEFVSLNLDLIEQDKANKANVLLSVDRSNINIQKTDEKEIIPLI